MSDTNRVRLSLIEEGSFGVIPTNPKLQTMRWTGGDLAYTPQTKKSDELREDRQITDLPLIGYEAAGNLNFRLSFANLDIPVAGVMLNPWTNMPVIENSAADTEITQVTDATDTFGVAAGGGNFKLGHLMRTTGFTNAANNGLFRVASSTGTTVVVGGTPTLTDEAAPPSGAKMQVVGIEGASGDITATATGLASTALDFTTLGLAVGMWVKVGGSGAAYKFANVTANNGWARISAISATALTFDIKPTGWGVDNGAGKTIRVWVGDYIRNGVTLKSHTIERYFGDIAKYEYFRGMCFNTMNFTLPARDNIAVTASLLGKDAIGFTQQAGATYKAAPTFKLLNTSNNIGRIAENGAAIGSPNYLTSLRFTINNNLRGRVALGENGFVSVGTGECDISGQIESYFGDETLYQKVLNNTETSLDFRVAGQNSEVMLFDLPAVKFGAGAPTTPGSNQDVMVNPQFQAYMHATLGYQIHAQRFWYVET